MLTLNKLNIVLIFFFRRLVCGCCRGFGRCCLFVESVQQYPCFGELCFCDDRILYSLTLSKCNINIR